MSGKSQIPPDDALLCERCGYDLAGLRRGDECPECGFAVEASLRRLFLQDPIRIRGAKTPMLSYWWAFARHPILMWDRVEVSGQGHSEYQIKVFAILAFFPGTCLGITRFLPSGHIDSFPMYIGYSFLSMVVFALLLYVPTYIVLVLLTNIEEYGIRFFGRRRGWRITSDIAESVTSHACFAWAPSCIGVGLAWGLFSSGVIHQQNVVGPISSYAIAMFVGFLPGLLWFETLVWIGMRKLRYANVRGSERHLADAQPHGLEARATGQVGDGDGGGSVADSSDRS